VRLVVLLIVADFLLRVLRRRRGRAQHPKQTEVQLRQVKQEVLEGLVRQEGRDVSFNSRQDDGPQPAAAFDRVGSVGVDRKDGFDEIVMVLDGSDLPMNGVALSDDLLGESTESRDVEFVCDGVDVDVVGAGGGGPGKRRGVAES
jgi:hypothetical protein